MDNEHGAASKAQDKSNAKFNTFLQAHLCSVLHLECMETEHTTKDLIGIFASFLLRDEHACWQTSMNYLSSVQRLLKEKTQTSLFVANEGWYDRMRSNLSKQYLLKLAHNTLSLPFVLRSNGKSIPFTLARRLVANPFDVSSLIFSQTYSSNKNEEKASAYINNLLRKLKHSEDNAFGKDLKSHSSRRGSAVQALSNANVSLFDAAHRGRWTMDDFTALLGHIAETSASDQKVAWVLVGWDEPSRSVHPPQLSCSVDCLETARLKREFASALFIHYHGRLQPVEFIRVLAASLLLNYKTAHQVAPNRSAHKALSPGVKQCCPIFEEHEAHQMLSKWSVTTREAFVVDHILALPVSQVAANLPEDEAAKHCVGVQSFQSSMPKPVVGMRTIAKDDPSLRTSIQGTKDTQNEIKPIQTAILDLTGLPATLPHVRTLSTHDPPSQVHGAYFS
ncbi:hypothetical protein FI667_g16108, partial [Globisporangium splendens]